MFNFISNFLLTAAASQNKQNALAKKYGLDPQVMEMIADVDPTLNGEYTEWLAREASRTHLPKRENLTKVTEELGEYVKVKRNPLWAGEKNILNLSYDEFSALMERTTREDYSGKQKVRDIEENAKKYIAEGVLYLGKAAGCYVYQPTTAVSAAAMSKGTHWCTQSEDTARSYLSNGNIFVVTKPDHKNSYDNDKYIQIYASPTRIEAETAEGKDLSSLKNRGLIFTQECFELVQFLGNHDAEIKEGLASGAIHLSETDSQVCSQCHGHIETDDEYEHNGEVYCEECYHEHFSNCAYCGDEINLDEGDYNSTDDGDFCYDCSKYCPDCEHAYVTKGRRGVSFYEVQESRGGSRNICESCFGEGYFTCEECDDNFSDDEQYDFDGDSVFCKECFDKKWREDVEDTLKSWVEEEGLEEVIAKEVAEQANKVFSTHKQKLAGEFFAEIQKAGYLYSWDDMDLQTILEFLPASELPSELRSLSDAMARPVDYAINTLTEEMELNELPSAAWGTEEVMDWLESNDVVKNERYQGYNYISNEGVRPLLARS